MNDVCQMCDELKDVLEVQFVQLWVGLIFDYDVDVVWVVQLYGVGFSYFGLVFDVYKVLCKLGFLIDILCFEICDFIGYDLIFVLGLMYMFEVFKQVLFYQNVQVLIGLCFGV